MVGNEIRTKPAFDDKPYWLRGIGHEEKKLSRIMLSLKLIGCDELSYNLQQTCLINLNKKGFKTGRDIKETTDFWSGIFERTISY